MKGNSDGPFRVLLTWAGTVDLHSGGVVHIRGFEDLAVAGCDGDRIIFAVYPEIPGGGELDVVSCGIDAICIWCQPFPDYCVGDASFFKAGIQLGQQTDSDLLLLGGIQRLDGNRVGVDQGDGRFAVIGELEIECGGEGNLLICLSDRKSVV